MHALAEVRTAGLTIRGLSLGGVYTALWCPELRLGFDAGVPIRAMAVLDTLVLSHAHADHVGALPALLGMRGLAGVQRPLRIIAPRPVVGPLTRGLAAFAELQRYDLATDIVGVEDGDVTPLRPDLALSAHKAFHPVPCLAYRVIRTIKKLRPEFTSLTGPEIARRKLSENLFTNITRTELAYATDTLVEVLDQHPELLSARVLLIECTFYDEKKSLADARAGCHIHWRELAPRLANFTGEAVILMHTSQLYEPGDVPALIAAHAPPTLRGKIHALVPARWPL